MTAPDTYSPLDGKPKVIIVGAGIAGLFLAILLEKAHVPYDLYERATKLKTLGSAIFLGANITPLFKQLGIYDEFVAKGKACNSIDVFNEKRKPSFVIDFKASEEMAGGEGFIISRSALYDILLKQVPACRLHMGKKVLSTLQGDRGVLVRFSDSTSVDGDILVGADGAYSGVRQSMYERLKKDGKLPPEDEKALPYSCVWLVGQSSPMDPAKIPELNEPLCRYRNVIAAEKRYSWSTFTLNDNIVCWAVIQYLDGESAKLNDSFRSTEWGSEAAEAMCKEVWDFPIPGGDGTLILGDVIANTPMHQISKAMLEEKLFETWYHGRTVLIGDACNKTHPAGGEGALVAIQNAVVLANWINVLPSRSMEDMEKIFKEYRDETYPVAKAAYDHGRMMGLTFAKGFKAAFVRYWTRNMPEMHWKALLAKHVSIRPQVAFLPLAEDFGKVEPIYQPSLEKTLEIMNAHQKKATKSAHSRACF